MPRRPEIGNVQLYPNRPLHKRDKNGYVLKFYCPILQKRVRKNCGTRDRREARKILRECRERLLDGRYVESDGAITEAVAIEPSLPSPGSAIDAPASLAWEECFDRYIEQRRIRVRDKSLDDAVLDWTSQHASCAAPRKLRLTEGLPVTEVIRLTCWSFCRSGCWRVTSVVTSGVRPTPSTARWRRSWPSPGSATSTTGSHPSLRSKDSSRTK